MGIISIEIHLLSAFILLEKMIAVAVQFIQNSGPNGSGQKKWNLIQCYHTQHLI
jgi:hypothetical protein